MKCNSVMRTTLLCAIVILMASPAQSAKPYKAKSSHVQFGIGATLPMGLVSDHWSAGFSANFGVAFTTSHAFEIVPKLEYSHLPFSGRGPSGMAGSSLNALLVGVDFSLLPHKQNAQVGPVVTGGVGIGRIAVAIYPYYEYAGLKHSAQSNIYFSFGGGFAFYWRHTPIVMFSVRTIIVQGERTSVSLLPISLSFRFL